MCLNIMMSVIYCMFNVFILFFIESLVPERLRSFTVIYGPILTWCIQVKSYIWKNYKVIVYFYLQKLR